jgi:hypothetical protein
MPDPIDIDIDGAWSKEQGVIADFKKGYLFCLLFTFHDSPFTR